MRKILLSFILAMTTCIPSAKIVSSVKEIKNTIPNQSFPVTYPIVRLSVAPEKITPKPEPLETETKETIDDSQTFEITSYSAGYESTQKHKGDPGYGITASGERVTEGITIACSKSIPFGTQIYIVELDHTYTCQDRGQAITEGHIDIYMNSVKRAKEFGRRKMKIKILKGEVM